MALMNNNLFKVIPDLLSDVNHVHQTSISLLIVAPETRFGEGCCGGYIHFYKILDSGSIRSSPRYG